MDLQSEVECPSSILPRATPHIVASRAFSTASYGWLSDRELLTYSGQHLTPVSVNVDTGAITKLPKLQRELMELSCAVGASLGYYAGFNTSVFLQISPDGRWIVGEGSPHNTCWAYAIDGSRRIKWTGFGRVWSTVWSADSRKFVIEREGELQCGAFTYAPWKNH